MDEMSIAQRTIQDLRERIKELETICKGLGGLYASAEQDVKTLLVENHRMELALKDMQKVRYIATPTEE